MGRKPKGGVAVGRKARLSVTSEEEGAEDPVAAAIAAKEKRQEGKLRAAAAAAAKLASASLTTFFADDVPPCSKDLHVKVATPPLFGTSTQPVAPAAASIATANKMPVSPEAAAPPGSPGSSPGAQGNPLSALLNYSQDESSGSEAAEGGASDEAEQSGAVDGPALGRAAPAAEDTGRDGINAAGSAGESLDAELANFMEELEADGLLKDHEPEPPTTLACGAVAPDPLPTEGAAVATMAEPAPEPLAQDAGGDAAVVALGPADVVEAANAQSGAEAVCGAGAQDGGQRAEQRVLGALEGAPGWHEVLDTGGGVIYFWNAASNEVAWQPPPGAVPRPRAAVHAAVASAAVEPERPGGAAEAERDALAGPLEVEEQPAPGTAPQPISSISKTSLEQAAGKEAAIRRKTANAAPILQRQETDEEQCLGLPAEGVDGEAIDMPGEAAGALCEAIAQRAHDAAQRACGPIPPLVYLAVEAEVRLRDWHELAARQRAAAGGGRLCKEGEGAMVGAVPSALTWHAYERHLMDALRMMEAALPVLAAASAPEPDTGPKPPLPGAEALALTPAPDIDPAAPEPKEQRAPGDKSSAPEDALEDGELLAAAPLPPDDDPPIPPHPPPAAAAAGPAGTDDIDMDVDAAGPAPLPPEDPFLPESAPPPTLGVPPAPWPAAGQAPPWPAAAVHPQAPAAPLPLPSVAYMFPLPSQPWALTPHPYAHFVPPHLIPVHHVVNAAPTAATAAAALVANPAADLPPLPADEADSSTPPLPEETGGALAAAEPALQPAAAMPLQPAPQPRPQREYSAPPVRAVAAPAVMVSEGLAAGGSEEEQQKRKRVVVGAGPLARKKRGATGIGLGRSGRGASALLDKWAAARKDLEDAEAAAAAAAAVAAGDPNELERRRAAEAEAWRARQLRSGVTPADNANFQPLAADWRAKLLGAKAPSKDSAAVEAPAQSAAAAERPKVAALSRGLPPGWKALWDRASGEVYYGNLETRETSWERPT